MCCREPCGRLRAPALRSERGLRLAQTTSGLRRYLSGGECWKLALVKSPQLSKTAHIPSSAWMR